MEGEEKKRKERGGGRGGNRVRGGKLQLFYCSTGVFLGS